MHKSFQLDGRSYDRDQLLAHCFQKAEDGELPVWKKDVYEFISLFLDPSLGDIVQKTSGTTGDPGAHILRRKSLVLSAGKTLDFFKLAPGDRVLHCLPMHYVAGKLMVVRALVGGLQLLLTEPSGRPLRNITDPLAFAAMVPLQVHESLMFGDSFASLSTLLIGGGKLPHSFQKRLARLDQTAVYESFGMTETYTHFALKRINGPHPDKAFRLLEGVKISQDRRNCLVVDVEGITKGPHTTSDLVEIQAGGQSFTWLGRYDHVINSGGIKIIPELLEERIRTLIQHHCLLLSEPDERLGNRLVLLVESGEQNPPLEAWQELLKSSLSPYELPRRVVTCREIPRNQSMKLDRRAAKKFLSAH